MALIQRNRAVGVFSTQAEVESAINNLRSLNFPMENVSVLVRDLDDETGKSRIAVDRTYVGNKVEETAVAGTVTGGALGSIAGLLMGVGAIAIPGFGAIALGGAAATALAAALSGSVIGAAAGGLLGGLIGLGIPEERAKVYSEHLSRGEYLVLVEGTPDEIHRAQSILDGRGIKDWGIYSIPDARHSHDRSY